MSEVQEILSALGVALAIGLLVGVERGWQEREAVEGTRIAGVRTYGLLGLLGGVIALTVDELGPLLLAVSFIALAGVLAGVYVINLQRGRADIGITSLVAGLLTFMLGALAVLGDRLVAAACAVVMTLLLDYKPVLHRWLSSLQAAELRAGIKLLLISVVLLPVLPDRGFGPWQALNPYAIWWMVVLIAAISFVGYFAVKIGGARHGAAFTGIFGGLVSSTALTLHFARLARANPAFAPALATGILLACGTMYPRLLLLVTVLNIEMFQPLLLPALVMALISYGTALWYWWSQSDVPADPLTSLKNPMEFVTALSFGALLAVIMVLGHALQTWAGDAGVLVLAAVSGVADVDAITLSLAGMSHEVLALPVVVRGVMVAAAVNSVAKAALALLVGGAPVGVRVAVPLLASAGGGVLVAWWVSA